MKKLIFTLIVTTPVVGGAVAFMTLHGEPAKATATAGIRPLADDEPRA
jgi:hypothetical protein